MEYEFANDDDTTSVLEAYTHLVFLRNATLATVRDLQVENRAANTFQAFEAEIRLLHASIVALLTTINVRPEALLDTGLRVSEEAWEIPPSSAIFALEQFLHVLCAVEGLITRENADFIIPQYNEMHAGQFTRVLNHIHSIFEGLERQYYGTEGSNDGDDFEELDPLADVVGATPEQINSLPVLIAANMNEQECNICLQKIVDGQQVKQLRCSHFFHKKCIESWLKNNASCPLDRLNAFGST